MLNAKTKKLTTSSGTPVGTKTVNPNIALSRDYRQSVRNNLDNYFTSGQGLNDIQWVRWKRTAKLWEKNPIYGDSCVGPVQTGSGAGVIGYIDAPLIYNNPNYKQIPNSVRKEIIVVEVCATDKKLDGSYYGTGKGKEFSYLFEVHPDTVASVVISFISSKAWPKVKEFVRNVISVVLKKKPSDQTEDTYDEDSNRVFDTGVSYDDDGMSQNA